MKAPNFPHTICERSIPPGQPMQSLCAQWCVFMCRIVCLGDCMAGECVFHYSHINSEFSREEEAHKYKQNREKRERNIHVLPLSLCVIRGLQALQYIPVVLA